jgi:hypothetical protein
MPSLARLQFARRRLTRVLISQSNYLAGPRVSDRARGAIPAVLPRRVGHQDNTY